MDADMVKKLIWTLKMERSVIIASIISKEGSAPRTAGTKMLVFEDSSIYGTIGGGLLESKVIDVSRALFRSWNARIYHYDLSSDEDGLKESLDMICGGQVMVLLEPVSCSPDSLEFYRSYSDALEEGKMVWLIGEILPFHNSESSLRILRSFLDDRMALKGEITLTPPEVKALINDSVIYREPALLGYSGRTFLIEPIPPMSTVYLFGAGHVSQSVADLLFKAGFKTVVLDDRDEFANRFRFQHADRIHVISDFKSSFSELSIDSGSFIIILTRGHRNDQDVLIQALSTDAVYIGMIGSRRKWDNTFRKLLQLGFSEDALSRVRCPVGLDIGAKTPFEIAVSILAEVILYRSKMNSQTIRLNSEIGISQWSEKKNGNQ